jgi:hypothetical protein
MLVSENRHQVEYYKYFQIVAGFFGGGGVGVGGKNLAHQNYFVFTR